MARNENPPIGRGEYESTAGAFDNLVGKEWIFEDLDFSVSGARPARTNRSVRCRLCLNKSGINLLPKRMVTFKKTGTAVLPPDYGGVVDGYVTTTADRCYPIDEWLPAAGVPDASYFWVVVDGPATVLTDIASGAGSVFAIGDVAVGLTAATSQATTAGRVAPQDLTGATALLGNQLQNRIGRALSAKTTSNTAASLLLEVGHW